MTSLAQNNWNHDAQFDDMPKPDRLRVAKFNLTLTLLQGVPVGEVEHWSKVIERSTKTSGREDLIARGSRRRGPAE